MNKQLYRTLLAIDSSTATLQLGLSYHGDKLVKKQAEADLSHGQIIMRNIQDILDTASCTIDMLDGIIVNIGPGSFTGLRIGLASAKAIAVSLHIPIVSLHLFEIATHKLNIHAKRATVIIPFKKDEAFLYDTGQVPFTEELVHVNKLNSLLEIIKNESFAVYGWDLPAELAELENNLTHLIKYDASDLIRMGREKLQNKILADIELLEPLYIQKSQAEINFELRNRK